jgi:hypothetical protein
MGKGNYNTLGCGDGAGHRTGTVARRVVADPALQNQLLLQDPAVSVQSAAIRAPAFPTPPERYTRHRRYASASDAMPFSFLAGMNSWAT